MSSTQPWGAELPGSDVALAGARLKGKRAPVVERFSFGKILFRFGRLFARTGIRLALIQSLVVLASFAVAGYVSQLAIEKINSDQMRREIQGEMASMEVEYRSFGPVHLPKTVVRRTNLWRGFDYRLVSADRRSVVGKLPAAEGPGWSMVRQDGPGDVHFLALTTRLPDGSYLSIGQNLATARKEASGVAWVLSASGLLGVILCLGTSYLFSRGAWRRIEELVRSAKAVAGGQLDARVATPASNVRDDLDELGGSFNHMLDRLEDLIGQVRQVSSDIAHDLRTPLSRVRQRLDKLRHCPDDKRAEMIALIEADLDNVLIMFAAILRLAEIESEGPDNGGGSFDLGELVRRMADTYRPDIEAEGRALTIEAEPAVIDGDAGLVAQAIANLFDNVLRHTPPGTAVAIRAACRNGVSILSVSDRGPGVPVEYREQVLRRHWRLASHRPGSGSGLGLAIVAAIARKHRAHLTLADACPGLAVTLTFPAVAGRRPDSAAGWRTERDWPEHA